jgi:hypothetical protein
MQKPNYLKEDLMKKINLTFLSSLSFTLAFVLVLLSATPSFAGYIFPESQLSLHSIKSTEEIFKSDLTTKQDLMTVLNEGKESSDYYQKIESEKSKTESELWNGLSFSMEYLVTAPTASFDPKIYWGHLLTSYFFSNKPLTKVLKNIKTSGEGKASTISSNLIPDIQFSLQAINKGMTTLVWNF